MDSDPWQHRQRRISIFCVSSTWNVGGDYIPAVASQQFRPLGTRCCLSRSPLPRRGRQCPLSRPCRDNKLITTQPREQLRFQTTTNASCSQSQGKLTQFWRILRYHSTFIFIQTPRREERIPPLMPREALQYKRTDISSLSLSFITSFAFSLAVLPFLLQVRICSYSICSAVTQQERLRRTTSPPLPFLRWLTLFFCSTFLSFCAGVNNREAREDISMHKTQLQISD